MSKQTRCPRSKGLPLETSGWTEKDEKTGADVHVISMRRGVLKQETRHFQSAWEGFTALAAQPTAKQNFEDHCQALRNYLSKRGLPSDATPSWVKRQGGEWELYDQAAHKELLKSGQAAWAHWTSRLEALTDPLSAERLAGEVLFSFSELLKRKEIDEHLWHILGAVSTYSMFRIAVSINEVATAGIRAGKARSTGPLAIRDRAVVSREIVWTVAQQHWNENPLYRNDGSNTAAAIAFAVNKELVARNLPVLKPKTIADHIRAKMREKIAA